MTSHTNSTTWSSPAARTSQRFTRLQNAAQHLDLLRSPFFPRTAAEYARHQAGWAGDVAERERRRLRVRIEEVVVRRRMEGEAREDRGVVERGLGLGLGGKGMRRVGCEEGGEAEMEVEGFGGLQIEEGQGGARLGGEEREQSYEEQLAEARAGKAWIGETEVNDDVKEVATSENGEAGDSSSEQVNSPVTENVSKEGSGNGKTKRKNHRGNRGRKKNKGSKGKNKVENGKLTVETPESIKGKENINPATPTQSKAGAEAAASPLSYLANDPLKAIKVGTVKEPTSDLWRLFKTSPLYNTAGGGAGTNAMFASLQRPGQTPVLGAATYIWAGDEHLKPEGRRDPFTNDHRAAWPEMNELKAEGQYRKEAGTDRRLPIPRMDMMTKEAIIRAAGGQEKVDKMSQEEADDVCREQAKKTGDQIPWMDRQPIRFDGIDRLDSVDKQQREENKRRRNGEPICGPQHYSGAQGGGHSTYASHAAQGIQGEQQRQRRGTNSRLRGGYNYPGTPRRQAGFPPPVQQKLINPDELSYGADGLGDGMIPQPRWVFDEEYLKQKGEWEDLLENHL